MAMMRKAILLLIPVLLLVPPVLATEEEPDAPPEDKSTFTATTGGQGSSTDGNLSRVAEYQVVENNPVLAVGWSTSLYAEQFFTFDYKRVDNDQQSADLLWDAKRVFKADVSYDSFLHRLDHDSLANLNAVSEVKVVRSTDFEPDENYQIRYQVMDANFDYQPSSVSWLSLRADVRGQRRTGRRQHLSMGHCTSCHVTAQGREVDETIQDAKLGAHVRAGIWDFDLEVMNRDYKDEGAHPTMFYEQAIHPAALSTPFNDRVWFQNQEMDTLQIPDITRQTGQFKMRGSFGGGSVLNFTALGSKTQNDFTDLEMSFSGLRAQYVWRVKRGLKFNFIGDYDKIDNDSAYVDLVAMNGLTEAPRTAYPAPPLPPGQTNWSFQEWRQAVENDATLEFETYTRESAWNRQNARLGFDAYWRARPATSLRFGYKYSTVDRDNVILADGTGKTTSQRVKLSWNERINRRLRWNNSLFYDHNDNPFMNVDGACREFLPDPNNPSIPIDYLTGSPKSPNSLQYYQLHQLRVADVSNQPSKTLGLRSQTTWSPQGTWQVSANFRWKDSENDELDTSTWTKNDYGFGAFLWVPANSKIHYTLGFDILRVKTDTVYCVPVMDG